MTIVFDFDGTIHNTLRLYGQAFRQSYAFLVEQRVAPPRRYTDEEVSVYLGMSAPDMWRTFMPQLPQALKDEASAVIGRAMIAGVKRGEAVLYDGIAETLRQLKAQGHCLLILSNCRVAYMDAHRQAEGLDDYFTDYFCAEQYNFIPKEQIFPLLAARYPDEHYCMVGDRSSDIQVGIVHHIPTIGCLYGFGSAEELSHADYTVHTPAEILSVTARLRT